MIRSPLENLPHSFTKLINQPKTSVLFVCMGNICRSPSAEGMFRWQLEQAGLIDRVRIDSAGTHAYHQAQPPDIRAQNAALSRGIDISMLRARKIEMSDYDDFDYILAMDQFNLEELVNTCPKPAVRKIELLLKYASNSTFSDVPDPYYGGKNGFERVLDLLEDGCSGFLSHLRRKII